MGFTSRPLASFAAVAALLVPALAQTYSNCDPLKQTCPPDKALGTTVNIDFTTSKPSDFTTSGTVSYGSDGLELEVSETNKGPYLQSDWYMMFGRVDVTMKAAPGAGVVSSFILQSDDLDEIDLEWVGDDTTTLQTNFFGKGFTGTYNRGVTYDTVDAATDFHTYSIDWNAERTEWLVDGKVLRTLLPSDFPGQYPQSPMFIKFGPWAAGDPSNNPKGTVQWADGPIDYSAGPFPMFVQSITATDYSTGTAYKYTDESGTWESIEAIGGSVNGGSDGGSGKTSISSLHSATSTSSWVSSKPKSTTTSIPIPPSTSKMRSSISTLSKSASAKPTSGTPTSDKPTSLKTASSKPSSSTKSDPPSISSSPRSNSTMPTGPKNGSSSATTRGTGSSTGASSSPTAPHSGAIGDKQMASVLLLVCIAFGTTILM